MQSLGFKSITAKFRIGVSNWVNGCYRGNFTANFPCRELLPMKGKWQPLRGQPRNGLGPRALEQTQEHKKAAEVDRVKPRVVEDCNASWGLG